MPTAGNSNGTGASPDRSNDVLWHHHGVPFIKPEVQLLLKANGLRAKDQQDFDAASPLLEAAAAAWLRESLATVHPGRAWLTAFASLG